MFQINTHNKKTILNAQATPTSFAILKETNKKNTHTLFCSSFPYWHAYLISLLILDIRTGLRLVSVFAFASATAFVVTAVVVVSALVFFYVISFVHCAIAIFSVLFQFQRVILSKSLLLCICICICTDNIHSGNPKVKFCKYLKKLMHSSEKWMISRYFSSILDLGQDKRDMCMYTYMSGDDNIF